MCLGIVWAPQNSSPTHFRPETSLSSRNFLLYNSPDPLRSVYRFLVMFLFRLVSARVCFQFRAIMASAGSDESKEFPDGDHQDTKAEEEVVSKAEEEEESGWCTTLQASRGARGSPLEDPFQLMTLLKRHQLEATIILTIPLSMIINFRKCQRQSYHLPGILVVLNMQERKILNMKKDGEIIPRVGTLSMINS